MRACSKLIFMSGFILCFLYSCDNRYNKRMIYEVPNLTSNQSEFTDRELLNATYSDYKFPTNFYNENLGDTSLYYVNTVSVDSLENGKWIELSTNLSEKARYWSIKSTYENSQFKQGVNNEKFFEFIRIQNPKDNLIIKFRTHNSSYFTRDDFDLLNKSNTIGVFTKQTFTANEFKELIDYLWFVRNYSNGSAKILSSFPVMNQQTIEIHHYELFIGYGDFNLYDEITLLKRVFEADRISGEITVSEIEIRKINGEYN